MAPPCDRSVVSLIWFRSKNHKLAGGKAISSSFMSAKHVRVLARSIHVPRASRQLQAADAENIAPTKEERDIIDKLPYFQYEPKPSTQGLTKAKRAYLERKLPIVHELFKDENSSRYLTYNLPAKLPNPYLDAHARPITDPVTGNVKYGGTPRLSVTKMLTKRWCELREAYDIYSRVPIFQHRQVTQGRREHQRLEDEIHAPLSDIDEFKSDFEIDIPDDAFHTLVEDWFLTIVRLLTLFQKGHAREILCHGYIDSRTSTFIHGEVKGEQHVLVSGVVDHLILRDRNSPNDKKQVPLENNILVRNGYDLTQVIKSLSALVQDASKDLELVVSDVKTRATKTVPRQHSVVKASKLQVMYYRYFLEELSKDTELTYQKLLTNAERRGFDVDKPVSPAKIINLLEIDGIIRTDMERLQKGESIEFPSYDSDMEADGQIYEYNWEELDGQITDLGTRQKYGELFTKWGTPVTLRYFAARLAQLYSCLNPLLSQNLLVEYYSGDVNFHNISFNYDKKELESESFDSAQFWFGRRDIEPIKPNLGNLLTYCKYCDYESVCLWKKEGKETCRKLGQELTSLDSSQEN